jgi:hypothetical protein
MTPISSPHSEVARRAPSRSPGATPTRSRHGVPTRADGCAFAPTREVATQHGPDLLGRYADTTGRVREVIGARPGDGSVLVVDRDAATLGDRRLVAHLAMDEPTENAALVCAHYLEDASRGRCRRVSAEDLTGEMSAEREEPKRLGDMSSCGTVLLDRHGADRAYRLEPARVDGPTMELRWRRHPRHGGPAAPTPVCIREVIGAIESYEPVCGLTLRELARYRENSSDVSVASLRSELERLRESPIVLNRRLRQAVLATIERYGLSMSEIAIRCGRIKRDCKGKTSGETSWLARRIGILPESGASRPTPWVHSDVLALIARNGLGISPREVELG